MGISFFDVARLDINDVVAEMDLTILNELFTIDKAVGIHPVLSFDSDTHDTTSKLRAFFENDYADG